MNPVVFLSLTIIIAILSFLLLFYEQIKSKVFLRTFRKIYYRKIHKLVKSKDWRLINNFYFKLDENSTAHIDHLIFADKYIYCIIDKYWRGGIIGKENDVSWFFYSDEVGKSIIDNPLAIHKVRLEKLGLITGLEKEILIGIVVVNNSCTLEKIKIVDKSCMIVKLKKLKKTILTYESQNVGKINDEQLQKVVYEINNLKV